MFVLFSKNFYFYFFSEPRASTLLNLIVPLKLMFKVFVMFPLLMTVVGFVALSGANAGVIALVIASVTALASLLEQKKSSHEIVSYLSPAWNRASIENNKILETDVGYQTMAYN